jgi:hypothetical protein
MKKELERNWERHWTYATAAAMIRAGFRSWSPTAMRLLCCQNMLLNIPPVLGNICSPWSYTQQLRDQHEGGHISSSSSLWGDEDLRLKIFATKMMSWVCFQADPKLQCSHSFSFRRVLRVEGYFLLFLNSQDIIEAIPTIHESFNNR